MTDKTLGAYQRHEKAITDRGGDVLTLSTGHPSARTDEVTVHIREHFRGRTHSAAVHVSPRELRAALDEFAPVRECPDPEQHNPAHDIDWQTVAEQHEDAIKTLIGERDEARARLAEAAAEIRAQGETIAELAAETRPEITDAMVLRFMNTYDRLSNGSKDAPSLNHFTAARTSLTRTALTAALSEPPARPEGAEEIERLLTEGLGDFSPPATPEAIADLLAVRGVRVIVGAEQ